MDRFEDQRKKMVELTVARRGVSDRAVLLAMKTVPRHAFLPENLAEFAYRDTPLPIAEEQTISQPYIVALMLEAAQLRPGDRLLEVGTGSGYAAAVASRVCARVDTIERHASLAEHATEKLRNLGYTNVNVRHGDGSLGWPEHAPYDAIVVAAGGPDVPPALLEQLVPGGRLVIPLGPEDSQVLVRLTLKEDGRVNREELGGVRFVPLIGAQGWRSRREEGVSRLIAESCEPIGDLDQADLSGFLERVGNARVVLLGEATHGSSEFYRWRTRITRELVLRGGFTIIAAEADWPDAGVIDRYVRHRPVDSRNWRPFDRFPQWMWRNEETVELIEWIRAHNAETKAADQRAGFFGLDLYSLFISAFEVIAYLDRVDPTAARVARARYGLLTPWQTDPAAYGRAAITGNYRKVESEVVRQLKELFERRIEYARNDGDRYFDAVCNARVVVDAERYYRVMYYGSAESWNLRDQHMFDTLESLLDAGGPSSRAVVWAHNSHVGDASATEMGRRGEHNIGQLCRKRFGDAAYSVGFGTDHGTVRAARAWGEPGELMRVQASRPGSYEDLLHQSGVPAFSLPLRAPRRDAVRAELEPSRLERAIGVIYRPQTEGVSHYFEASLPNQFDEYVWFDETHAVHPLALRQPAQARPTTWPFSL